MPNADLPTIDLFAGAGGLSLGLARSGLLPVVASEKEPDAVGSYRAAHERYVRAELDLLEGDVASHDFSRFRGNIAVVAGGPPCQPYSLGGARLGVLDSRDGIPQFIRVIDQVRPEAFIMENVPGLARGKQLPVLLSTVDALRNLGYNVEWRVLHAADYGVAQRRQRVVVVGSVHVGFEWPVPSHGEFGSRPWVASREVLDAANILGEPNTAKVTYARTPDLRPSPYDGHLWNGGGRPINPDGLVPTLLASMGGNKTPWLDGSNIAREYHSHLAAGGSPRAGIVPGARRITVTEASLVQGFPSDMPWSGRASSRYRQIGNAVPVALAAAVGAVVARHLTDAGVRSRLPMLVA